VPIDEDVLIRWRCANEDHISGRCCAQHGASELMRNTRFNDGDFDVAIFRETIRNSQTRCTTL
jgi:hypothetical protein